MTYALGFLIFTAGSLTGAFIVALVAAGAYGVAEGEAYHRAAERDREIAG